MHGNLPGGKINSCIADLSYLGLVDAGFRRLVLTNPDFYVVFMTRMRGAIAHGIEVVLSPLDAELPPGAFGATAQVGPR